MLAIVASMDILIHMNSATEITLSDDEATYLIGVSRYGARRCHGVGRDSGIAATLAALGLIRRDGTMVRITRAGRDWINN